MTDNTTSQNQPEQNLNTQNDLILENLTIEELNSLINEKTSKINRLNELVEKLSGERKSYMLLLIKKMNENI